MEAPNKQPWWEKPAKAPGESGYEAEQERLREALSRAWRHAHRLQPQEARSGRRG